MPDKPPPQRTRIVVSAGDPAGIGPEVVVKALADAAVREHADVIVAGDERQLAAVADRCGVAFTADRVLDVDAGASIRPGHVSAGSGRLAVVALEAAVDEMVKGGADALVTAPISKAALREAGYSWPGQTEALSEICGVSDLRVMLVGGGLRVAHVTAHASLAQAVDRVTEASVLRTIELAHGAARRLGAPEPRIAVLGLNPHAGENGILGDEDSARIAPAVEAARSRGIDAHGPESADSLYPRAVRGEFEVVVAMYHDQGHIPVKLLAPNEAVAVTLGLPFLRTSADHGAAPEIAATYSANAASMIAATRLAASGGEAAARG
jgi:4-phospho-D-threonate 3-dehydrogenase / 4-phospho-D-erythronate 3-dehydrogenase